MTGDLKVAKVSICARFFSHCPKSASI